MKAYRISTDKPIAPFGDQPGDCFVLNQRLIDVQEQVLRDCGVSLVKEPPKDETYVLLSDRVWFSTEILKSMLQNGNGRLQCTDELWTEHMTSITEKGMVDYDLAIVPAGGSPNFDDLEPMRFDWGLRDGDGFKVHPMMEHAVRPMRVGVRLVAHLNHWCDLLRINQYAL